MSRRELERDGHAVLERWPRLKDLWRYCRHLDAWMNRELTEGDDDA